MFRIIATKHVWGSLRGKHVLKMPCPSDCLPFHHMSKHLWNTSNALSSYTLTTSSRIENLLFRAKAARCDRVWNSSDSKFILIWTRQTKLMEPCNTQNKQCLIRIHSHHHALICGSVGKAVRSLPNCGRSIPDTPIPH